MDNNDVSHVQSCHHVALHYCNLQHGILKLHVVLNDQVCETP